MYADHTIQINVPLNVVYRQWTEFESYPYFMEGVKSVQRLSDIRLIWLGEVAGEDREWYTEVTQMIPNQLLAWRATSGLDAQVVVRFTYLGQDSSRIDLSLDYAQSERESESAIKTALTGSLERFKQYIEDSGYDADVWRGEVERAVNKLWSAEVPAPVRRHTE